MQTHHKELGDEQQNHQHETEGGMQYEVNRKEINNLKLERSGQKANNQNTELSKRKPVNILKIQNDESTKLEKIKKTENNNEMHEGNQNF